MVLESVVAKFGLSSLEISRVTEAVLLDSGLDAMSEALGNRFDQCQAFAIAASVCETVLMEPIGDVAPNSSIARRELNAIHIDQWMHARLLQQEAKRIAEARKDAILFRMESLGMIRQDETEIPELYLAMAG